MSFASMQTQPTECARCGEKWPHDPALFVDCPACPARAGFPCKTPSGHTKMGVHNHRDQLALDRGFIKPCNGGHGYQVST